MRANFSVYFCVLNLVSYKPENIHENICNGILLFSMFLSASRYNMNKFAEYCYPEECSYLRLNIETMPKKVKNNYSQTFLSLSEID